MRSCRSGFIGVLSGFLLGISFVLTGCSNDPMATSQSGTELTPQLGPPPTSIAEARRRVAEIAIPSIDSLDRMITGLLARNAAPSEREVLAAIWRPLQQERANAKLLTGSYPGGITSDEFWLLAAYPKYISATKSASDEASYRANVVWPGNQQDTKADAFRHSYWNALLSKRIAPWWAIAYTDAHESESPDNTAKRMDLNNNNVGRTVYNANKTKSESQLVTILKGWTYTYVTKLNRGEQRKELVYFKK